MSKDNMAMLVPHQLDQLLDILRNPRRRVVISYLESNMPSDRHTLADHLNEHTSCSRKSCLTGLHQSHLPRMSDAKVIDYDYERGLVSRDEMFSHAVNMLNIVESFAKYQQVKTLNLSEATINIFH